MLLAADRVAEGATETPDGVDGDAIVAVGAGAGVLVAVSPQAVTVTTNPLNITIFFKNLRRFNVLKFSRSDIFFPYYKLKITAKVLSRR
jgi:hypothetical protein